jgi:type IV pilus assembly protein PilA
MYCFQCGTQNDDNAFKCVQCGTVLQEIATQTVVVKKNSTAVIAFIIAGVLLGLVAIAGILAAIAIPAYMDFSRKAKLTEAMQVVKEIKTAVEVKASSSNLLEPGGAGVNAPDCTAIQDKLEITVSRRYISEASVICNPDEICTITATIKDIGASIDGQSLVLSTANPAPDLSQWHWSKSTIPARYAPK